MSFPAFVIHWLFNYGHSDQCETVVLICISLIINNVEHLFMSLVAICVFFGEMSVLVLSIFDWIVWFFWLFSYMNYLYILEVKPLSVISFVSILSWSAGCCLVLLWARNVFPMFSSRSFMVSCLIFKSLSHFEFILVCGVTMCSNFIEAVKLSQHHLLKRLSHCPLWQR